MDYIKKLKGHIPWPGDYSKIFKTLALPMVDRVFVRRHRHLIFNSSHSLGKDILKELNQFPKDTNP